MPDELAHALPALLPKKGSQEAEALESAEEVSKEIGLPTEQLQRLRLRQHSNARIFERQKLRVWYRRTHLLHIMLVTQHGRVVFEG